MFVEHFGRRTGRGLKVSVKNVGIKIHSNWPPDRARNFIDGRQSKYGDVLQRLENCPFEDAVKVKFSH